MYLACPLCVPSVAVRPIASHRILLSPHEWTWTQQEQEDMARECIRLVDQKQIAERFLREIMRYDRRSGPQEALAAKALRALGFDPYPELPAHPTLKEMMAKADSPP